MVKMLGICKALYDYASQQPDPQEEDRELSIEEGELLYILEESDDGWWKVKKKAEGEQEEGDEGLVPANYIERAHPIAAATALYDYEPQTSEEITLNEGSAVQIYDKDDADWFLVEASGSYGFAPSNYLEEVGAASAAPAAPTAPIQAARPPSVLALPTTLPTRSQGPDFTDHTLAETDEDEEQEAPPRQAPRPVLPTRVSSAQAATPQQPQAPAMAPRPVAQETPQRHEQPAQAESKPYRTWSVQEVEGKKKKKGTLGLGNMEISWAPDKATESITTWPITSLVRYSTEKKHVFVDLQGPPQAASFDFHAGSTDTADEIAMYLGELAGAARAPGIREIAGALNAPIPALPENSGLARKEREGGFARQDRDEDEDEFVGGADLPGPGEKMATVMYDFEAQGDDEVTVRAGARVLILDDKASRDWWKIRAGRREGVIPADYLEVTAPVRKQERSSSSNAERHRSRSRSRNPERAKELKPQSTGGKSKPDPNKVRSWTDRSRSFKVDAQLLGCSDGKIHLHKVNGVKISVPVSKMCEEDIEYVEHKTGQSLKEPVPKQLDAQEIARQQQEDKEARRREAAAAAAANKPTSSFDWFDFFLSAGCDPNVCQRYTTAFEKEGLTEDDVADLQPDLLRRIGCKEGDVLKIGRLVAAKTGRAPARDDTSSPGIISGPGGVLKNNTRRGRPERNGQVNDTVDASGLRMEASGSKQGFDDDAWQAPAPAQPSRPTAASATRVMDDLSLLDQPLQPTHAPAKDLGPVPPAQLEAQRTAAQATQGSQSVPPPSQQPQQPDVMQQIARIKAQQTAAAVPAFMPQTQFGAAIVSHKTGGGDISTFVAPPLYPHQTGYQQQQQMLMQQQQQMAMMQQPAPYQDPFKTGVQTQMTGFVQPMATGFQPQQSMGIFQTQPQPTAVFQQQPMMALQPQQTSFAQVQQQQQTGFNPAQPFGNSALPPFGGALATQPTGFVPAQNAYMPPQQTGFMPQQQQPYGGFGGYGMQPQQPMMGGMMMQPQPQMSAGMIKMQEMMAQAQAQAQGQGGQGAGVFGRSASAGPNTGPRRANLSAASAQNPFGF